MDQQAQRNKETVRRFNNECIEEGNERSLDELIHPGFINHTAPAGTPKTKEAAWQNIKLLRQALAGLNVEILMQVAEDDLVTTHKILSGIHTTEFMGIAPTGRKVNLHIIDIIRLKNDQYIEHWSIRDIYNLLSQLTQA